MKPRAGSDNGGPSLDELLSFAQSVSLTEVVWEKGSRRIAFKRSVPPLIAVSPVSNGTHVAGAEKEGERKPHTVRSPMVGTFLRAPKGRPPLVVEGDDVTPGVRMGLVEAMQVPKDVTSSVKGKIRRVLVENGHSVEYGQPLFEIDVAEGA
ncbi:MAG: biotin/lipoyl-binding protein [Elusimicrobia bacterium]|nr:biotin/lipoyl-binding protein [Elusimicrobiota bacterium]